MYRIRKNLNGGISASSGSKIGGIKFIIGGIHQSRRLKNLLDGYLENNLYFLFLSYSLFSSITNGFYLSGFNV